MKTSLLLQQIRMTILLFCSMTLFVSMTANAFELEASAVFKPDPANPMKKTFLNTTLQSGYCFYYPTQCGDLNIVGFRITSNFAAQSPISAYHPSPRQGAFLGVPGQWRSFSVTNVITNEIEQLEVRIAAIGVTHQLGGTAVQDLVGMPDHQASAAWNALWVGQAWGEGAGACKPASYSGVTSYIYSFLFYVPPSDEVCAKQARFDIPFLQYVAMDIGYELRTPSPLTMATGVYKGNIKYMFGPGGIDLGDNIKSLDDGITFNFTLDVQHTLKVDVPPGGNRVELEPQGGWQSWLTHGRKPTRLFKDQTFNISASSRFKMTLDCSSYNVPDNTCNVENPSRSAKLNISVTLPNGLTDADGQSVNRRRLKVTEGEVFHPGFYVDRKPGTLHFEIEPDQVAEMISPGERREYSATVTVIWDSEVG